MAVLVLQSNKPIIPQAMASGGARGRILDDNVLAAEVRYLHSLWRNSPSAHLTTPTPTNCKKNKKKPPQQQQQPQGDDAQQKDADEGEWGATKRKRDGEEEEKDDPWISGKAAKKSNGGGSVPVKMTEEQAAELHQLSLQHRASLAFSDFLSDGSDDDDDEENDYFSSDGDGEDGAKGQGREAKAERFFCRLFEEDEELRKYYESHCNCGSFECLVCSSVGARIGKRFPDCVSLVHHSMNILKTKRKASHRAFARSVCSLLGWNAQRLPSASSSSIPLKPRACIPPPLQKDSTAEVLGKNADSEKQDNINPEVLGKNADSEKQDNINPKSQLLTDCSTAAC